MKQIIRDYLTFNKRERNGVFVLISIIVLMIIYLNISEKFITIEKEDFVEFQREMDSLNTFIANPPDHGPEEKQVYGQRKEPESQIKKERFNFDPNNLSESDWMKLGLSEKQIRTIKNYEAKGGRFKKKEDLKKMYCVKNDLYTSLEPYIRIAPFSAAFDEKKRSNENVRETVNEQNENSVSEERITSKTVIELNSADSAVLTTIKGIGAFYAKTIIKYRNSLGGFYSKEQLLEVWKFDLEKFNSIEKYISVDPSKIKKININVCEADQLKNPYIKWNVANAIVNYRKHHGSFKTIDDISKTDLVDDETLRKIAPYLIIE